VGEGFAVERALILQGKPNQSQIYQAWHRNEPIASELVLHFSLEESSSVLPVSIQCQPQAPAFHFCTYSPTNCQSQRIESSPFDSCLSVPLFLRQEFFGTVTLVSLIPSRTFSLAESQTLEVIAQQIAIAVQNAQTQQRLQKLQQCTQELAEEKQRSEAVNQAKTEFLSHIHHELRTPLTGILGFSRLLKDELYGSLNPKQKQYVSAIATSGEHLLALVNDFLDMSKIEANREELYWETIPAEEVCLGAITMLQSRAAQQGLELRLEVAQNVDFCRGDQRRLKQILVNLLSNALKFTEAGSVTLQVKRQENMLEFSVIDTGIGIKKEDYQKLFQPFQQIQNHLSRKHKGTGLGLTLSRKLAQLHGGDITFASEEGKGSCFTLHLPV
jgi:signal transduction histidine kinase